MRVIVKHELCEGNGVRTEVAPEVFIVGEDDKTRPLIGRPDEALRAKVSEAVRRCPRQALAIEEQ